MTVHWSLWLIAGGIVLAIVGIVVALRARANRAQGTVSRIVEEGSGEYPVVEFSSPDGVISFRSKLGASHRVGESVPVDLVEENGRWKVRRAGLKDPCERDLD